MANTVPLVATSINWRRANCLPRSMPSDQVFNGVPSGGTCINKVIGIDLDVQRFLVALAFHVNKSKVDPVGGRGCVEAARPPTSAVSFSVTGLDAVSRPYPAARLDR